MRIIKKLIPLSSIALSLLLLLPLGSCGQSDSEPTPPPPELFTHVDEPANPPEIGPGTPNPDVFRQTFATADLSLLTDAIDLLSNDAQAEKPKITLNLFPDTSFVVTLNEVGPATDKKLTTVIEGKVDGFEPGLVLIEVSNTIMNIYGEASVGDPMSLFSAYNISETMYVIQESVMS